ncbi:DNA-(apurinic or apyrimidinic site) lyase 2, partial [Mortierella antarctica]
TVLEYFDGDIVCITESRLDKSGTLPPFAAVDGYNVYSSNNTRTGGRYGVLVYVRDTIVIDSFETGLFSNDTSTTYDRRSADVIKILDQDGRTVVLYTQYIVFVCVYMPAADSTTADLEKKMLYAAALENRVRKSIEDGRSVVVLADMNIAPTPSDHCSHTGWERRKGASFVDHPPRVWLRSLLSADPPLADVFRHFHPDEPGYTYRSPIMEASRQRKMALQNQTSTDTTPVEEIGTRIDFVLASMDIVDAFQTCQVLYEVKASDHSPLVACAALDIWKDGARPCTVSEKRHAEFDPPRNAAFSTEMSSSSPSLRTAPSKDAPEWGRLYDNDDGDNLGHSSTSDNASPKLAESPYKAADMLEVNNTQEVMSFSRSGQVRQFVGFSTAKNNGRTFVPITVSKAAQVRALRLLEMEEPTSTPDPSHGSMHGRISPDFQPSAPIMPSSRNRVARPVAPASMTSHPVRSTHMNNLKNKCLRSASNVTMALPGALKPLSRSTNPIQNRSLFNLEVDTGFIQDSSFGLPSDIAQSMASDLALPDEIADSAVGYSIWATQIQTIGPKSGTVGGLQCLIHRRYPVYYQETLDTGAKVLRSLEDEALIRQQHGGSRTGAKRNVSELFMIRVGNSHGRSSHAQAIITLWRRTLDGVLEGQQTRITNLLTRTRKGSADDVKSRNKNFSGAHDV